MSFRSGDPISTVEVYQALATEGPIEAVCVDVCPHPYNPWLMSSIAMVTFAYVDDFKDAIKVSAVCSTFRIYLNAACL